jgi:hypothetical protein
MTQLETNDVGVNEDLCKLDAVIAQLGPRFAHDLRQVRLGILERHTVQAAWHKQHAPMIDDWNRIAEAIDVNPHDRQAVFNKLEEFRRIRDALRLLWNIAGVGDSHE